MFSVHTKPEEFEEATITDIVFRKLRFKCTKTQRQRPSVSLKSAFEKLRFRDGLMWTVGLTVKIKVRFQISPA